MQIKFLVTNLQNSDYKEELFFDRVPINIGRESKCDLLLSDPKKLVSRQHAKIVYTDDEFRIIDLLSRNLTYKNGDKLNPEKEYQILQGDLIKIGDYNLEVIDIEKEIIPEEDSQKTMVFSSPFSDEVAGLGESFKKILDKYLQTDEKLRDEYLRMTIFSTLSQTDFGKVGPIITEYLAERYLEIQKNIQNDISVESQNIEGKVEATPIKENVGTIDSSINYSFDTHFTQAYDVLLDSITKLIQGFWQFRQEFFGVTIYQSLPTTSVEKLKAFLFDPAIKGEERNKRLELFKEELNKVLSHQVGLLDGYKESIDEGIKKVLAEIDPILLEKNLKQEKLRIGSINIPYKYIPFYIKSKLMQIIKSMHKKFRLDVSAIERKHFRPAFMKGYQKRLLTRKEGD